MKLIFKYIITLLLVFQTQVLFPQPTVSIEQSVNVYPNVQDKVNTESVNLFHTITEKVLSAVSTVLPIPNWLLIVCSILALLLLLIVLIKKILQCIGVDIIKYIPDVRFFISNDKGKTYEENKKVIEPTNAVFIKFVISITKTGIFRWWDKIITCCIILQTDKKNSCYTLYDAPGNCLPNEQSLKDDNNETIYKNSFDIMSSNKPKQHTIIFHGNFNDRENEVHTYKVNFGGPVNPAYNNVFRIKISGKSKPDDGVPRDTKPP